MAKNGPFFFKEWFLSPNFGKMGKKLKKKKKELPKNYAFKLKLGREWQKMGQKLKKNDFWVKIGAKKYIFKCEIGARN